MAPPPDATGAPTLLERVALALLGLAGVAAFVIAHRQRLAWALLLPLALSPFLSLPAFPALLRRVLPRLGLAAAAATALFGVAWTLYPVLSPRVVELAPVVFGWSLGVLLAVFLLAPGQWPPATSALPAALALLLDAALDPLAALTVPLAVAAAALFAYVLGANRPVESAGAIGARLLRAGAFSAVAAVVALGIIRLLPWAQPQVEQAIARQYGSGSTGYTGLGDTSRLGDIESLALSPRVVMRVWTDQPQRLRARVLTRFDGAAWHRRDPGGQEMPSWAGRVPPALESWLRTIPGNDHGRRDLDPAAAGGPQVARTKIVQEVFNNGQLVSPAGLLLLRLPTGQPRLDPYGVLLQVPAEVELYGLANDTAAGNLGAAPCAECLEVPADTEPRVRELAAQLGLGASPQQSVQRTSEWLARECRYSLKVGKFRTQQPVAEFLFEKKRGYCEYFASAAALLLRLQGVPTRYVAGFNVTQGNGVAGHFLVREADAHAWIEALLPDVGWVEVDPTPASQYDELHQQLRPGRFEAVGEWFRSLYDELWARVVSGDWRAALYWLASGLFRFLRGGGAWALGAAALVAVVLRWRKRPRPAAVVAEAAPSVSPELLQLVRRVEVECARRGFPRPPSQGPLEHLGTLAGRQPAGDEWLAASRAVVECFYRARFGEVPVRAEELAALASRLDRAGQDARAAKP